MEEYALGDEILRRLRDSLGPLPRGQFLARDLSDTRKDPFCVLIGTIISQNTTERNTYRAFKRLEEEVGVTPEAIVKAGEQRVREAIRVAGLQDAKARAIVAAARRVLDELGGDLSAILKKGVEDARRWLLEIPGVGYKTADVVLANWGFPVLPVDTHIRRVAQRLGLGSGGYEAIRASLERIFRPELRLEAHLYLILFGRRICKSRNPQCDKCPLRDLCKARS